MTNPVSGLRILPAETDALITPKHEGEFTETLRSAMDQVDLLQNTAEESRRRA